MKTLITILFARLVKKRNNKWISNPLTMGPIYFADYKIGRILLDLAGYKVTKNPLLSSDYDWANFKFKDLYSRLREFFYLEINPPDDEMCKMLMVKLFSDKQIIIKNTEIFDFIFKRIRRTHLDIYMFVEKLDRLSLEKKRQLTIPLIKEII